LELCEQYKSVRNTLVPSGSSEVVWGEASVSPPGGPNRSLFVFCPSGAPEFVPTNKADPVPPSRATTHNRTRRMEIDPFCGSDIVRAEFAPRGITIDPPK